MGRFSENSTGASIVELMISLSALGVVTTGGMVLYNRSQKTLNEMGYATTMQVIANSVETALQNSDVILFSSQHPDNTELKNCIKADSVSGRQEIMTGYEKKSRDTEICEQTDPKKQSPVMIIMPPADWKNIGDVEDYVRQFAIASGGDQVVKYDKNGRRGCEGDAAECPFEARAWFWAFCPRNSKEIRSAAQGGDSMASVELSTECDRAQSINIRYQVTHNKRAVNTRQAVRTFTKVLPSIPRDEQFWEDGDRHDHENQYTDQHTTFGAIVHDVSQMGRYSDFIGICKTNFTLVAIEDSKPICKCLPPYSLSGTGRTSYCMLEDHYCKANERYMGTDLKGNAICEPVVCIDYEVEFEAWSNTGTTFAINCDEVGGGKVGGWLSEIEINDYCQCYETKNTKKADSQEIEYECSLICPLSITCCYEQ